METLARLGFGARGLVYLVVGGLAVLAAIGQGGGTGGSESALRAVLVQPFGTAVVGLLALGLAGFATWRVVEAITDADHRGRDAKALATRSAHLVSGAIYFGLAATAIGMAAGRGGGGGEEGASDWTAWLLQQPFGRFLVAAVGIAVVGGGIAFGAKAIKGKVADRLNLPSQHGGWICTVGRIGYGARAVVFMLIGGFLLAAAWSASSSQAKGLGGALETLRTQPFGPVLLGITAAGLAAFGVFGLVQARYRRVDAPDLADALPHEIRPGRS